MEETEVLRAAQSALRFIFVVGADGGAFAQPASRSLPFVLTNSIASTRNAGVPPTAMTAELVLVRRPRSDMGPEAAGRRQSPRRQTLPDKSGVATWRHNSQTFVLWRLL